jgi:hypothetical protein
MAKTWKRLRDVVTVANDGDQISQFTFDANDYLKVVFFIKKEGTGDMTLFPNAVTSGSNTFTARYGKDFGSLTSNNNHIGIHGNYGQLEGDCLATYYISNKSGEEKLILWEYALGASGDNAPDSFEASGKYTTKTGQITSFSATCGSGGFGAGTWIAVYGIADDVLTDEKTTLTNVPINSRYEEVDTRKIYRRAIPSSPEASKNYVYGTSQVPAGANATVSIGDSGTKMYLTSNSSSDSQKGYQYTLSTAYDVSTASYASKSFQFGSQSQDTRGMKWKNNGIYCYKMSDQTGNKAIYRYTASTAWDISTLGSNQSYTYSSVQTGGKDVELNDDGTKMYGLADNATIYQYTLSTAWQVSSGVSSASKSHSCQSQDNAPRSFQITNSGTKLRYLGSQYNKLYTYTLSTAWDISTASYDGADSDIDCNTFTDNPYGVWCKDDFSWLAIGSVDSPYDVQQFDKDPVWKERGVA